MSSPINAITPALFQQQTPETFIAANGTTAKILVDAFPGAAASGTTPALYGGGTVIDLTAVSTDSSPKDVILYAGFIATTQSAGATGTVTTTTNTLVRASGSFITDGWQVGDLVMTFAPYGTAANTGVDGILGIVTTVSATTLTVNGTPFAAVTLATGTRIVRVTPHCRMTVAANAGTNGTTSSVALLNNFLDGSLLKSEIKVGSANMLIVAMQSAVSALPAYVSIRPVVALY